MRLDSDFIRNMAIRSFVGSVVSCVFLVVFEIVSPLPAVLDHWQEEGSDGGFRRDTTAN